VAGGQRAPGCLVQILAGITNADIVLDPGGQLAPGATHRILFYLTEADYGADAILLCGSPRAISFALVTPERPPGLHEIRAERS
jgi:hypothetical protein